MVVQDQVEWTIIFLQTPIEGPGIRRRVYPCPSTPSFIFFTNLAYNAQFLGSWHYRSVSTILVPLIHIRGVTPEAEQGRQFAENRGTRRNFGCIRIADLDANKRKEVC